jgi:hypothetical protein
MYTKYQLENSFLSRETHINTMPTALQDAENSAEHSFYLFCAAIGFLGLMKAKGIRFRT